MRIKKHAFKCVVSLMMALVLVFGMVVATTAVEADVAETAVTGTVYFKNTGNWSTVNAYVWINGTTTSVQAWPGQAMTKVADNVYKYTISGDYNMIIFNNGSGTQTGDLSIPGVNQIYDYAAGTWSAYTGPTTEDDTTTTETTKPTQGDPTDTMVVYCENEAGWSSVNAYMWSDALGDNGGWPGKTMKNIGDNIWQYEVTSNWNMIIFNNGSGTQTGDMSFPGNGYIYNNKTQEWKIYDTSPIRVSDFGSDLAAPQYKGTDITLTADATSSEGDVAYKFSVTFNGKTTVLSDYTTANSASWTPSAAGTYTIVYDFVDTAGNENQRTATYEIKDDAGIADPILKGVYPKPCQLKKGTQQTFTANAAGGQVGTKLLFYKFTVKDANGLVVNVPYYTKNASYNFTPTALGTYTVTVSVQNSENDLIERTFTYTSVNDVTDETQPTLPIPTKPTTDGSYLKGDTDGDGEVLILDATVIQLYLAQLTTEINLVNAECDGDGELTILDATAIQMYLAKLDPNW